MFNSNNNIQSRRPIEAQIPTETQVESKYMFKSKYKNLYSHLSKEDNLTQSHYKWKDTSTT